MKPLNDSQWSILGSLIEDCCSQLLASLRLPVAATAPPADGAAALGEMAAIVGFAGEQLAGSVLIKVPRSLVRATHPVGATCDDDLCDWLGELANQLVGRLKLKLLDYGTPIHLSTPTTLTGEHITSGGPGAGHRHLSTFVAAGDTFAVFVDAIIAEGAALVYAPPLPHHHSAEGEIELF